MTVIKRGFVSVFSQDLSSLSSMRTGNNTDRSGNVLILTAVNRVSTTAFHKKKTKFQSISPCSFKTSKELFTEGKQESLVSHVGWEAYCYYGP